MENIVDLHHLKDHTYHQTVRVSARLSQRTPRVSRCPCCASGVDSKHHRPAAADVPSKKRKRTSAGCASTSPALAKKLRAAIPPEDLPEVSPMVPSPRPSNDLQQEDSPLQIHQLSVGEYKSLYHTVVETDLKHPSGRLRPYSKALGLRLKEKLWRSLNQPTFTETVDETGLVQVNVSYGKGNQPPQFDVDISREPKVKPYRPAAKPSKKKKRASAASTSISPQPPAEDAIPSTSGMNLKASIPPEDLPEVCPVIPGPGPSTAVLCDDSPLKIHNLSVDKYKELYHAVVEKNLKYPNGRQRPYSKALGLRLKQKLWESLNRPTLNETQDETGRVQVGFSYGEGVYPPMFDVDVSGESQP